MFWREPNQDCSPDYPGIKDLRTSGLLHLSDVVIGVWELHAVSQPCPRHDLHRLQVLQQEESEGATSHSVITE